MSSNRVGGPTPAEPGKGQEKTQAQQHRRIEKVEKVREVDEVENERTRKKFQSFMEDEPEEAPRAPSPFETNFYFVTSEEKPAAGGSLMGAGAPPPQPDFGGVEDAAVPNASPAYAPPPDVNASPPPSDEQQPLPRSRNFWSGVDAPPDQPPGQPQFRETPQSATRQGALPTQKGKVPPQGEKGKLPVKGAGGLAPKEDLSLFGPPGKLRVAGEAKEGKAAPSPHMKGRAPEKKEPLEEEGRFALPKEHIAPIEGRPSKEKGGKEKPPSREEDELSAASRFPAEWEERKKESASPFALPTEKKEEKKEKTSHIVRPTEKEEEKKVSPFAAPKEKEAPRQIRETREGKQTMAPLERERKKEERFALPHPKEKEKKGGQAPLPLEHEARAARTRAEDREGGGREGKKDQEKKIVEIASPGTPPVPPQFVPIAQAAAIQAAPYLSREILPLFFQMVGTISVMSARGISRTEVVLNSPSFSQSKFYGATITIEKYATAPDSLNIRLTGSNEAVTTFNQNIPNLMASFQNGDFNFRIGRIDVEYSVERPVFRRKEQGEGKKDFGGGEGEGDFKDRKK